MQRLHARVRPDERQSTGAGNCCCPLARKLLSAQMRPIRPPWLLALVLALLGAGAIALAACGKGSARPGSAGSPSGASGESQGAQTRNTTRLGGADPVSDAAAVALAAYPGLTSASRPQAVVLVDGRDWPAALAGAALASAPLQAPLLYAEGNALPAASANALRSLHPTGAGALGGAQVIEIGTSASVSEGLRVRAVPATGEPAAVAATVENVLALARGGAPRQAIVLAAGASQALQMPAAGLAAESGAPILYTTAAGVPPSTAAALTSMHGPSIYVLAPATVPASVLAALGRYGHVTPILAGGGAAEAASPAANADAIARFSDGTFGWGVKEPGHGLVFASALRPLDGPAAAPLSATGDYGPLLLLEDPEAIPPVLTRYLSDIQPAYGTAPQYAPVHGAYNHGWLIGGEAAISARTQAELDSMLEIVPRHLSSAEEETPAPE